MNKYYIWSSNHKKLKKKKVENLISKRVSNFLKDNRNGLGKKFPAGGVVYGSCMANMRTCQQVEVSMHIKTVQTFSIS